MRELATHEVPGEQCKVSIIVVDEPGAGGANHLYNVQWETPDKERMLPRHIIGIPFHKGPRKKYGQNGITQEALLAIVIDRLEAFQRGPFPCEENGIALRHLKDALEALKQRTAKRIARGVEGTLEK